MQELQTGGVRLLCSKQPRHHTRHTFRPRETINREGRQRPQELRPPAPPRMGWDIDQDMQRPGSHLLLRPVSTDSPRNRRPADQHREAMEGMVERRDGGRQVRSVVWRHSVPVFATMYGLARLLQLGRRCGEFPSHAYPRLQLKERRMPREVQEASGEHRHSW
jgi:hypothetical protein